MKTKSIDELEGRALDAAVAVEMLGWRWRPFKVAHSDPVEWAKDLYPPDSVHLTWPWPEDAPPLDGLPYENSLHYKCDLPRYSDDAWPAVLDAMEAEGWGWLLGTTPEGEYEMELWYPIENVTGQEGYGYARESTRAEAVCRGALRALAAEGEDDG